MTGFGYRLYDVSVFSMLCGLKLKTFDFSKLNFSLSDKTDSLWSIWVVFYTHLYPFLKTRSSIKKLSFAWSWFQQICIGGVFCDKISSSEPSLQGFYSTARNISLCKDLLSCHIVSKEWSVFLNPISVSSRLSHDAYPTFSKSWY